KGVQIRRGSIKRPQGVDTLDIRVDTPRMPPRGSALLSALITLAIFCSPASAAPKKVAFKFSAATYSVPENAGTFDVTVVRSGNTSAAASIAYSDNGTGTATGGGTDYS